MNLVLNKNWILIFVSAVFVTILMCYAIPKERILKRDREISRIKTKTDVKFNCIQYALIVRKEGFYPCYNSITETIYMYVGEVWKYGKTCNGENGRYPGGLPYKYLRFTPQFIGTENECLILEKEKIYSYPSLPECRKRNIILLRPPGNKIDR